MGIQDIFAIRLNHGYIFQIFLAEMIFFPILERRDHFWIRMISSFIVYVFAAFLLTNIVYIYVPSGLNSVVIFLVSLAVGPICFKSSFKEILFCYVSAMLLQNLSHNIENLIYLPFKENISDVGWFFLSIGVMLVVYVAAFFIIRWRFKDGKKISIENWNVIILAVGAAIYCYLIQFLLQLYELDQVWVNRLPLIFCDLIALVLLFILLNYKWKVDENAELEQSIAKEEKYYRSLMESMDLINMKAHDLKHFINDIRSNASYDEEGLKELQETVANYEHSPNTGNKALDVVLSEKEIICSNSKISLTTIVHGELLNFMNFSDTVSLFGNLLSNAIECEQGIADEEKRYITLKVIENKNIICIHVENYCEQKTEYSDGLPKSTKGDDRYHGYGLKSVRYIVKKYNGNLTVENKDGRFTVNILLPEEQKKAAETAIENKTQETKSK